MKMKCFKNQCAVILFTVWFISTPLFSASVPAPVKKTSPSTDSSATTPAKTSATPTPSATTPEASSAQGQLPEVVIKGGEKSGVMSERRPLQLDIDPDEPVLSSMEVEKDLISRQPESFRNPSAGFSPLLENTKTILPARSRIARDPAKVFYPLREILAVASSQFQEVGTGWEMTITDPGGRAFRKFSGRGLPPSNLSWNGRSDRNEIIAVGQNYSSVVNYRDTRGQARTYVGDPFMFEGVLRQEKKGLIISLYLNSLFVKKGYNASSDTIEDYGMQLLQEAADWIKRFYFTFPVRVECYMKDANLSNARAQTVAKALQSLMLLPRGDIPFQGFPLDTGSERIDIVVTNR